MQDRHFFKAGMFALSLVVLFVSGWEFWLRNKGVGVAYDDGPQLWADKRGRVYMPADKATVFIGSSRIKYDLDIATWRSLTPDEPIQLAMEGSSPLPALFDLAADDKFKGKLVVDVTETLFFSSNPRNYADPDKNIAYFNDRTPAQRASFGLNRLVEKQLVFLDKDNYSLTAFLDKLKLKDRPGVFTMPLFPMEFGRTSFDRQNKMTDRFVSDTNLQRQVTNNWDFFAKFRTPPPTGAKLDSLMMLIKTATDKIKSRGGKIIFVRTPSSPPMLNREQGGFPREKYWNALLAYTGCEGIHFADDPNTKSLVCPEWSHLSPADAKHYTVALINSLKQKNWFAL
jgi:hypothetical protein